MDLSDFENFYYVNQFAFFNVSIMKYLYKCQFSTVIDYRIFVCVVVRGFFLGGGGWKKDAGKYLDVVYSHWDSV